MMTTMTMIISPRPVIQPTVAKRLPDELYRTINRAVKTRILNCEFRQDVVESKSWRDYI